MMCREYWQVPPVINVCGILHRLVPTDQPKDSKLSKLLAAAHYRLRNSSVYSQQELLNELVVDTEEITNIETRLTEEERLHDYDDVNYVLYVYLDPPHGMRFSNEKYGGFYVAESIKTAAREISHIETTRPRSKNREPIYKKVLRVSVAGELHNIKQNSEEYYYCYESDESKREESQAFGYWLKTEQNSRGLQYSSVRDTEGGTCYVLWTHLVIKGCVHDRFIRLEWNGQEYVWDGQYLNENDLNE